MLPEFSVHQSGLLTSVQSDHPLSPAALRAVSVNAAKALMEIFPIRHKEESRLRIEGNDGNVIFNVIVPQKTTEDDQREA